MRFSNRREELHRVIQTVEQLAEQLGLCPRDRFVLNLVVDEIATNAIEHAYPQGEAQDIELRVRIDAHQRLVIQLEDRGVEFNPLDRLPAPLDAPLEERDIGGLGIHLVRESVDDMAYERRGPANCLTLVYTLTSASA
jgi:anti-sigma regulatory factor (Ser/Thr protein kinase)